MALLILFIVFLVYCLTLFNVRRVGWAGVMILTWWIKKVKQNTARVCLWSQSKLGADLDLKVRSASLGGPLTQAWYNFRPDELAPLNLTTPDLQVSFAGTSSPPVSSISVTGPVPSSLPDRTGADKGDAGPLSLCQRLMGEKNEPDLHFLISPSLGFQTGTSSK